MHQSSALSPLLFVIVMEALSREFRVALSWELGWPCGVCGSGIGYMADGISWQVNLKWIYISFKVFWTKSINVTTVNNCLPYSRCMANTYGSQEHTTHKAIHLLDSNFSKIQRF